MMFNGMRFFVSPDRPRMVLSDELIPGVVPWPPGFKAEIDAWMLAFFGTANAIADGQALVVLDRDVHLNPRTYAAFRETAAP